MRSRLILTGSLGGGRAAGARTKKVSWSWYRRIGRVLPAQPTSRSVVLSSLRMLRYPQCMVIDVCLGHHPSVRPFGIRDSEDSVGHNTRPILVQGFMCSSACANTNTISKEQPSNQSQLRSEPLAKDLDSCSPHPPTQAARTPIRGSSGVASEKKKASST